MAEQGEGCRVEQRHVDAPGPAYVTLTIDPDGSMWITGPQNGETGGLVTLSGLSFHLLS